MVTWGMIQFPHAKQSTSEKKGLSATITAASYAQSGTHPAVPSLAARISRPSHGRIRRTASGDARAGRLGFARGNASRPDKTCRFAGLRARAGGCYGEPCRRRALVRAVHVWRIQARARGPAGEVLCGGRGSTLRGRGARVSRSGAVTGAGAWAGHVPPPVVWVRVRAFLARPRLRMPGEWRCCLASSSHHGRVSGLVLSKALYGPGSVLAALANCRRQGRGYTILVLRLDDTSTVIRLVFSKIREAYHPTAAWLFKPFRDDSQALQKKKKKKIERKLSTLKSYPLPLLHLRHPAFAISQPFAWSQRLRSK